MIARMMSSQTETRNGNPPPENWARVVKGGILEGFRVSAKLLTVIIPLYFMVSFLAETPLLPAIAGLAAPLMKVMDLPGEAAIPLVIGMLTNLYAAIAAMAPLGLTARQVTLMGIVLGISHNLLVETGVLARAGTRGFRLAFYRVLTGLAVGVAMARILPGG